MISPSTLLHSTTSTNPAPSSPLATATSMHNVANDNLEGIDPSEIIPFAILASQSLDAASRHPVASEAGTTLKVVESMTVPQTLTAQSPGVTGLPLQQLPAISKTAEPLISVGTPATHMETNTGSTRPSSHMATSQVGSQTSQPVPAQYLPQQSYSPQSVPTTLASSSMPIANEAFNSFASAKSAIAALVTEASAREGGDSAQHIIASASRNPSTVAQWGPVSVSQAAPMMQQAHEMLSPLREQLRFQIDQQIKQAELRLDPPELGKVELNIRLDGDKLHIQMHAANPAVRDALLMGLDRLRNELAMDHGGQIDVDINQDGQQKKESNQTNTASIAPASVTNTDSSINDLSQQDDVDLLA
ncbi:Flagellar hook-length control protein [Shewanella piezotolerans WP3]|uniref:Flagellar hook-length control protein n=1 Tax=Shewanella piezotolerans (strain WP3 / JCM 13877) TaxID=225849 RepID=B8CVR1_SHEPW|nr:flagellar hook-length control protein FliK [Shewanella piezotolerans]ACJ31737.1 Flagellar hook-length control protein [Shewanella piezotolerans WP3]